MQPKEVSIDPHEFGGYSAAWPAHCYEKMKAAGFRLGPVRTISPTPEAVQDAILPPWQMERSIHGVLTIRQWEVSSQDVVQGQK